jgi:protein-tyrosine kinase
MESQLAECERMLEGQVPLLGVVLNRARKDSIARYN